MCRKLAKVILIFIMGITFGFMISKLYYNLSYKDYSQSCNIESDETGIRTMSIKEANVECGCNLDLVDFAEGTRYGIGSLFSKTIGDGDTFRFSAQTRGINRDRGLFGTMSRNSERYFYMGTIDTLIEWNRK